MLFRLGGWRGSSALAIPVVRYGIRVCIPLGIESHIRPDHVATENPSFRIAVVLVPTPEFISRF